MVLLISLLAAGEIQDSIISIEIRRGDDTTMTESGRGRKKTFYKGSGDSESGEERHLQQKERRELRIKKAMPEKEGLFSRAEEGSDLPIGGRLGDLIDQREEVGEREIP